jgi:hypothetical protein
MCVDQKALIRLELCPEPELGKPIDFKLNMWAKF